MPFLHQPHTRRSFGPDTAYVASNALPSESDPIAVQYRRLIICVVYERATGRILDAEFNMVLGATSSYLASLIVGKNIYRDVDELVRLIQTSYNGISQKALITAMKNTCAKAVERTGRDALPDFAPFVEKV